MNKTLKQQLNIIIFGHESKWGRIFDIGLIFFVTLSVLTVMLETVETFDKNFNHQFIALEWFFTFIFTAELTIRLYCVENKLKYIFSFFGLIDLISILPSYLSLVIPGTQSFLILRTLRLLRIFRILKLNQYTKAGQGLSQALKSSIPKITVFLLVISTIIIILGTLIYFIEGKENGFTSIPKGVYWAIVTLTTVGYGDITPKTVLGQMLSSLLMIVGYGIIAVPTGIVSIEIAKSSGESRKCPHCNNDIA